MRIFFDHQIFSLQDAGGASRYFYELSRHLSKEKDAHIDLALGLNNSVYAFREIVDNGIRVFGRKSAFGPGILRYAINEILSNSVAVMSSRFDIYHSTLYRALPLVPHRRLIATHHDCIHEVFPDMFRNSKTVIENKSRLYTAADAIICVSESSRQDLLKYYPIDERRTHVVYHGFSPFPEAECCDVAKPSVPYVLYVGARGTYKNFMALLDAFVCSGAHSSYELLAVGGGKLSSIELERIVALKIKDRVRVIPIASDSVLAAAYRSAALLVYPSLYEGFGFPPLEAMSLGCPVLTANTSSMPEVCGDAAFYFDTEDPASLKDMLLKILTSPTDVAAIRDKGRERVMRYRWDDTATRTLQTYRQALGAC